MGSHLNHLIFTLPVFHDRELVAFSCSMAHWQDIGGQLGGVTRDIFSEGLQIPFVKIFGPARKIPRSLHHPRERACAGARDGRHARQLASVRTGRAAAPTIAQALRQPGVQREYPPGLPAEREIGRAAVGQIPDGVYEAESFMDDDGVNLGKHIPIKVRVEVRGDEMTIDLSGVSPQVAGFYNSGPTAGRSAAEVVFNASPRRCCCRSTRDRSAR